jgi:hypothetical protein
MLTRYLHTSSPKENEKTSHAFSFLPFGRSPLDKFLADHQRHEKISLAPTHDTPEEIIRKCKEDMKKTIARIEKSIYKRE